MFAIRKGKEYFGKEFCELSSTVYDKDGNEHQWKDLILRPSDDEEISYKLERIEIEKLRQEYAGMAMQGMLANSFGEDVMNPENVAKQAIKYANALIEELRKGEE